MSNKTGLRGSSLRGDQLSDLRLTLVGLIVEDKETEKPNHSVCLCTFCISEQLYPSPGGWRGNKWVTTPQHILQKSQDDMMSNQAPSVRADWHLCSYGDTDPTQLHPWVHSNSSKTVAVLRRWEQINKKGTQQLGIHEFHKLQCHSPKRWRICQV